MVVVVVAVVIVEVVVVVVVVIIIVVWVPPVVPCVRLLLFGKGEGQTDNRGNTGPDNHSNAKR